MLPAHVLHRSIATHPRDHDHKLLLGRKHPVLPFLGHLEILLISRRPSSSARRTDITGLRPAPPARRNKHSDCQPITREHGKRSHPERTRRRDRRHQILRATGQPLPLRPSPDRPRNADRRRPTATAPRPCIEPTDPSVAPKTACICGTATVLEEFDPLLPTLCLAC